jgi:hypothetical protein
MALSLLLKVTVITFKQPAAGENKSERGHAAENSCDNAYDHSRIFKNLQKLLPTVERPQI